MVLAPAMENAVRWDVGLEGLPNVRRVYEAMRRLPEFIEAD